MTNTPKDQDKQFQRVVKRLLATPHRPHRKAVSEMLTPSEIESLRQNGREISDYAQKAFAHLRPKKIKKAKSKK